VPIDGEISSEERIGLIDYTVQEARRFFLVFQLSVRKTIDFLLHWSFWRRQHQAVAQFYHYKRNSLCAR
jgi:hypothetical protein